jgi:hypothetical protein
MIPFVLFILFLCFCLTPGSAQDDFTIGLASGPSPEQAYMLSDVDANATDSNGFSIWKQPIDWTIAPYPVMHYSEEELKAIMQAYVNRTSTTEIRSERGSIQSADELSLKTYVSILSSLPYDPALRDQGSCGNCWVFAPTASIEIQMAQQGFPDRISIQAFNSGWVGPMEYKSSTTTGTYSWFACNGGTPDWFVEYYLTDGEKKLIPWSNKGADYADGDCTTGTCTSSQIPAEEIERTPAYTIDSLIYGSIKTTDVEKEQAIEEIKSYIDARIPVLLALFMPDRTAWQDFYTFWEQGNETTHVFDVTKYTTSTWNYAQGGGHQVLITGYYDNGETGYFECLNSWGGSKNRPNGTFLIDMNVKYDSKYRNGVLCEMFETVIVDIGEFIPPSENQSGMNGIMPGIVRA